MPKKKTKIQKPEIGQILYVTKSGWLSEGKRIYEFVVTKINTVSFYATHKDGDYEYRFDLKTFTHKGNLDNFYAYHTKEEIERIQAVAKEKKSLREEIQHEVKYPLPLSALREIKEIIDKNKRKR